MLDILVVAYTTPFIMKLKNIFNFRSKKFIIITATITVSLALITIICLVLFVFNDDDPNKLGAIVTNGHTCSDVGKSILGKGGNAVDAAIASLFCEGVSMAQSCGLGGGFLMTIYHKETDDVYILNARETAPAASSVDMYVNDHDASSRGILSAAVPGELRGYWRAYKRFGGGVPWKDIVQPTIDLCKNGILVTEYLAKTFKKVERFLYADPNLRESYIDPNTNQTYTAGQYVKRLKFAKTLEIIANEGGDAIHDGSLTDQFVEDVEKLGGIITKEDLNNYEPVWEDPIKIHLPPSYNLYTTPLPGSGAVLAYILNMLQLKYDFHDTRSLDNLQWMVESFKFAYGMRTRLGDTNTTAMNDLVKNMISLDKAKESVAKMKLNSTSQDPEYYGAQIAKVDDHGTAHISVLTPNGDAVSVTSTINLYFGSAVSLEHSDIILNDEMDDFSYPYMTNEFGIPPCKENYVKPGKRPLSSMVPSMILDRNNDVRMVLGAAGGTKITTAVALVIVKHLWQDLSIEDSVDDCRLHHQLFPMEIQAETCFQTKEFEDYMRKIGHELEFSSPEGFSAVTAVSKMNNEISATFDKRRPGDTSYLYEQL